MGSFVHPQNDNGFYGDDLDAAFRLLEANAALLKRVMLTKQQSAGS